MMDITQETKKKQVTIPRFTEKDFEVPVFTEDDFKPQNLGGTPPVQAGIEAPQQEKQGYFQGLGRKFKAGLNTVGEMITEIPQAAEALSDLPTKMLADGMINREVKRGNIDRETAFVLKQNKDTFIPQSNFGQVLPAMPGAETIGDAIADGRINKWFENNAKALSESATRYDKTATEYLKNKQFGKALGAISYGIAESLPATLAALVAPEGALMLGLGTGAQKYDEVKDNEDMSEAMKVADAFTTGMFEWLFEKFGTAEMGKYLGNYVRRTGKDGIQKAFTSGPVMDLISKGYKKFGIWFAPMHEGVSEVLTTMGQNAATKYTGENPDVEIMDNTIESFLVGAGMGGLFSSTAALANKVRGGTPQQPINQLDPDQGVKDIINVYGERLKFNSNVPLAEDQNPLMSIASHKIEDKKFFLTGESGKLGDHVFTGYDYDALKEVGYDFTQVTPRLIKASEIRERMDIPYQEWLQSEVDLYKQTQVQGQQLVTKANAPVQEGQEITLGDKTFNVTFVDENGITLNEIDKNGNLTEGELIVPPEDYEKVFGVPAVDNGQVSPENVTKPGLQPQNIVTEQGQSTSVDNTLIPQLPVNKKGEIEYDQITEPDMYAQGLTQEFGEDAPAILEDLIAEQEAALGKAKKTGNAIEKARKIKAISAELKKLEGAKEILTPTATATQENLDAQSASPVVEQPAIESDRRTTEQELARPEEEEPTEDELRANAEQAARMNEEGLSEAEDGEQGMTEAENAFIEEQPAQQSPEVQEEPRNIVESIFGRVEDRPLKKGGTVKTELQTSISDDGEVRTTKAKSVLVRDDKDISASTQVNYIDVDEFNKRIEPLIEKNPDLGYGSIDTWVEWVDDLSKDAEKVSFIELREGVGTNKNKKRFIEVRVRWKDGNQSEYLFELKQDETTTDQNTGKDSPEVQLIKANAEVDTNPSEAQKEAENYKMGHVRIKGLDITIQNPVGSVRKGTDKKGNEWAIILNNTYGYIRGTVSPEGKGKKKDQIDVFLGDNLDSDAVYVVDQIDPETGKWDEHKVMMGFNSLQDAKDNYLANYEPGWKGLGDITKMSMSDFKQWVFDKEATQKPLAYKEVDEKIETKDMSLSEFADWYSENGSDPQTRARARSHPDGNDPFVMAAWREATGQGGTIPEVEKMKAPDFAGEALDNTPRVRVLTEFKKGDLVKNVQTNKEYEVVSITKVGKSFNVSLKEKGSKKISNFNGKRAQWVPVQKTADIKQVAPKLLSQGLIHKPTLDNTGVIRLTDKGIELAKKYQKKKEVPKEPWQMTRRDFVSEQELVASGYSDGTKPMPNKFKEGDYLIDTGSDPYVYEFRMVDPNKVDYTEKWDKEENVLKYPEVQRYIEWFKQGILPSPITVVYNKPSESYKSTNRRRLLAARESGVKQIPAFVEIGKHKDLIQQALSEGKPVPQEVLGEYPELKPKDDIDRLNDLFAERPKTDLYQKAEKILSEEPSGKKLIAITELIHSSNDVEGLKSLLDLDYVKKSMDLPKEVNSRIKYLERHPEKQKTDVSQVSPDVTFGDTEELKRRFNTEDSSISYFDLTEKEKQKSHEFTEGHGGAAYAEERGTGDFYVFRPGTGEGLLIRKAEKPKETQKQNIKQHPRAEILNELEKSGGEYSFLTSKHGRSLPMTVAEFLDSKYSQEDLISIDSGIGSSTKQFWSKYNQAKDEETSKAEEVVKQEEQSSLSPIQQSQITKINKEYAESISKKQSLIAQAEKDMREALLKADERNGLFGDTNPVEKDEIIKREEQGFAYTESTRAAVRKPFEERIAELRKQIEELRLEQKGKIESIIRQQDLFAEPPAEPAESKPIDKESTPKHEDFGRKIGGARKDMNITRTARDTESMPAWRRKYHYANADRTMNLGAPIDTSKPFIVQWSREADTWNGKRTVYRDVTTIDTREIKVFNSEEEAEAYIPIYEVWKQNFRIRKSGENYVITKTSSTGKIVEYGTFPTEEDATTYMYSTEGATSLLNHKREDFSIPALDKVERTGKDWRKGKDVTTEEFMSTFGFRGGEFGNWVKPEERRVMLNAAYDSFMDLAEILSVPPTALSFGGELSIAFGARGVKGAAAHFEPGRAVINLTRMNGAGSLAHEWAHAMDNYFGIQGARKDYTRDDKGEVKAGNVMRTTAGLLSIQGMRKELSELFDKIVNATQEKSVTRVMGIEEKQKAYDNQRAAAQREADALIKKFENGVRRYKYNRQTKRQEDTIIKATPDQVKKAKAIVDKILEGKGTRPKWDRIPGSKSQFGDYSYISPETLALNELYKEVFGHSGLKRDGNGFYNLGYFADKMYLAKGILDKALAGESETLNVPTDFLKASKEFDKTRAKPYWATKVEMFARAFEYFVQTKLEENNVRADYLQYDKAPVYDAVYGKNPYPSAEERAELNRLFQEFFDEVKVKTNENEVSLLYENEADYKKDQLDGYDSEAQRQKAVEEAISQTEGRVLDSGLRSTGDILQKVRPRTVLKNFKEAGYVDFIGQKIESPQDIADLWSIHRSPNIEKAHLIFVKDGRVVGTTASTINRIGMAMLPEPQDVERLYKKFGADGVYYLHNHPSGNHKPSVGDVVIANSHNKLLSAKGVNLLGSVVIDTNKFSFIDVKNNPAGKFTYLEEAQNYINESVKEFEYKNPVPRLFAERESILTGGWEKMFKISKALLTENKYKGAIVYLSSNQEIAAYDVFPEGASAKDVIRMAEAGLKNNLGRNVIFIHDGSYANEISEYGLLPSDTLDVIDTRTGFSEEFERQRKKGLQGVTPKRLWEGQSEYKPEFAGELFEGKDYRVIGERGATAVEGLLDYLNVARQMEKAGKSAKDIFIATGWERGKDTKWRHETRDIELKKDIDFIGGLKTQNEAFTEEVPLTDVIEDEELFNSYPELKEVKLTFYNYGSYPSLFKGGFADFTKKVIGIRTENMAGAQQSESFFPGRTVRTRNRTSLSALEERDVYAYDRKSLIANLSHELQHYIQRIEGFAEGTTRDDAVPGRTPDEVYRLSAGEVEARNVQQRTKLTREERKANMLSETEDIARDQQIAIRNKFDRQENASIELINQISELSKEFNTPVVVVQTKEDLPDEIKANAKSRGLWDNRITGVYDSGNVYIVLDALHEGHEAAVTEAKKVILHEIVAHKGLPAMLGQREYNKLLDDIYDSIPEDDRRLLEYDYNTKDRHTIAKEYLADMAENNVNPSLLQRIIAKIRDLLRKAFNIKYSENDIYDMLRRSAENLKGNKITFVGELFDQTQYSTNKPQAPYQFAGDWLAKKPDPGPNPDLLKSAAQIYKEKEARREIPETIQGIREYIQDMNLPVRKFEEEVLKRGGKQDNSSKPYRDMSLSFGRQEKLYTDFFDQKMKPILRTISKMKKAGIPGEEVLPYVISKHAIERNAVMRGKELREWVDANQDATPDEIDAKREELKDKDYSGVMAFDTKKQYKNPDELAWDIVREFESRVDKGLIDELWSNVKTATQATLETWEAGNQLSPDQKKEYQEQYRYFVPLRGWRDDAAKELVYTRGEGFSNSLKKAEGRKSLADNPLAYILSVQFQAIAEQVDNEVKISMYNLIARNLNNPEINELATIKKLYNVKVKLPDGTEAWMETDARPAPELFASGDARTKIYREHEKLRKPRNAREHEVIVRKPGGDMIIVFKKKHLNTAQALNKQNYMFRAIWGGIYDARKGVHGVAEVFGPFNNMLKAAYTSWNVVFPFTNFMRDFQEAPITRFIEGGGREALGVIYNYKGAFPAVLRNLIGKPNLNNQMDLNLQDFYFLGAATGYTHNKTIEDIEKDINNEVDRMVRKGTLTGSMKNSAKTFLNVIEAWNKVFEDATRFSVYLSALAAGHSKQDAAIIAKESTVNFNRKGKGSKAWDSWFAFFNVAMQSLQKNFKLAKDHGGRFTAVASSFMILGFLEALMNAMTDDDDKDSAYYNINPYMRQNYLVIPNLPKLLKTGEKGDRYLSIPLPQFWRGFKSIGTIAFDIATKKITPGDAVKDAIGNFAAGLLPIDIGGFWKSGEFSFAPIAPTVAKPIIEVLENRNYMGYTVKNEPFTREQKKYLANAGLGKNNVSPAAKYLTDMLYRWGGGKGKYKYYRNDNMEEKKIPGIMDWNPSTIEHIFKGYTGGTGAGFSDLITTIVQAVSSDQDIDFRNVPFVNRFIRKVPEAKWNIISEYYNLRDDERIKTALNKEAVSEAERTGDWSEVSAIYGNEYIQRYIETFRYYESELDDAMKMKDFDLVEGNRLSVEIMERAIQDIQRLKDEYGKK